MPEANGSRDRKPSHYLVYFVAASQCHLGSFETCSSCWLGVREEREEELVGPALAAGRRLSRVVVRLIWNCWLSKERPALLACGLKLK